MAIEARRGEGTTTRRGPLGGTRYRALRRIAGGATADVYEAVGPSGEVLAVKVIRTEHADSKELLWRLTQEGRALARLDHPHVVKVLDAGITPGGRAFLVMPCLAGETLRERIRREGPLPARAACELLAGALDGLAYAHAAGIVHRDVKPANLFLVKELATERAVLLDFGIAKLEDATLAPTTASHVLGTPRYVAPEQILGGEVDARTDVYAAGIVLFEAIAGAPPFSARSAMDMMRAHLEDRPKRLDSMKAAPAALDRIIGRALEKSPQQRFPTAAAFASALRALLSAPSEAWAERAAVIGRAGGRS